MCMRSNLFCNLAVYRQGISPNFPLLVEIFTGHVITVTVTVKATVVNAQTLYYQNLTLTKFKFGLDHFDGNVLILKGFFLLTISVLYRKIDKTHFFLIRAIETTCCRIWQAPLVTRLRSHSESWFFLHLHEIVEGLYFYFSLSVCVCVCVCVCLSVRLLTKCRSNPDTDFDAVFVK